MSQYRFVENSEEIFNNLLEDFKYFLFINTF